MANKMPVSPAGYIDNLRIGYIVAGPRVFEWLENHELFLPRLDAPNPASER